MTTAATPSAASPSVAAAPSAVPRRTLARRVDLPPPARGQFGPDHTVVEVLRPERWAAQDPFILLMDDRLDGHLVAGPHPHAGFETVTFQLDGELAAESGDARLAPGDVEWTTAGSGIVHGPDHAVDGRFRLLQLWLNLPSRLRWTEPDDQIVRAADVPVRREAGAEVRLYSGTTGDLTSPTRNRTPVTLLDVRLEPGARIEQALDASHTAFLYVIDGEVDVAGASLVPGQVGWLDRADAPGPSVVVLANPTAAPARVLLYAGEPQRVPLVTHGPFVGETRDDIVASMKRYGTGSFRRY